MIEFQFQLGVTPIPKSVTESRIKENFDIFDFALSPEEMTAIESLETGKRITEFTE